MVHEYMHEHGQPVLRFAYLPRFVLPGVRLALLALSMHPTHTHPHFPHTFVLEKEAKSTTSTELYKTYISVPGYSSLMGVLKCDSALADCLLPVCRTNLPYWLRRGC